MLSSVIDRHPPIITAQTDVQKAITLLSQVSTPCLVVVEATASKLLGVFTERDVVGLAAAGADLTGQCLASVIRSGCPTWHESNLHEVASIVALFEQHQLRALPIVNDYDQPVGLLTSSHLLHVLSNQEKPSPDKSRDRSPLESSHSIENSHSTEGSHQEMESALRRQLKQTLLFQKLTDAIHAQCGSQRIFETTVTQVGQVFGVSQCQLLTCTTVPTLELAVAAEYAVEPSMPANELLLTANPYVLQILAHDRALASPNVYADPLLQPLETLCQQLGLKSALTVRTSYQGEPNGILTLHQCDRFRRWSTREIQLIEAIAAQVGMVLAQIRLLEQEKQQREAIEQQNLRLQQESRERQIVLRDLQQAEERWQLVVQASNDGIFDIDLTTGTGFYSDRFKEIMGYTDQVFTNTSEQWRDRLHPADRDRVVATKTSYLNRESPQLSQEYRLRCKDGTYKWVFDRALAVWDDAGTPVRILGATSDISERKQLELALQQSEAKLSRVLDSANAAIASVRVFADRSWEVEYRSVGYERIFGFSLEAFASDPNVWMSHVVPGDLEAYLLQLSTDIFCGRSGVVEYRFNHGDGTIHWISEVYTPHWDETKNCWMVTTVDTDVSDRKRIEETLTLQQDFLRSVINTPPHLIFAKDWNGKFVLANQALAKLYGTTVEALIGKSDADFNPNLAEVQQFLNDDRAVISTQQPRLVEEFVTAASGPARCFQTIKKPITSIDGQSTLVLGVSTDITDRNQMEQALRLIVEGTAAKTGREFFHSLVRHLAAVLQVRYAFVTELIKPAKTQARTLAFWQGDSFGENFEYELAGTPCEQVLAGEIIYYPDSIQAHFPQHTHLADLGVESYFGMPLNGSLGNVIGHLKVLDSKPLAQNQFAEQILRIFAARAGAELERQQAEDILSELLVQTQQQSIELEKARDAAEAANRAKSEFLANMSHELRTPLNAILGFTQIMGHDTLLNPKNREYVNIINRSGQHLLELINDVLEMSKIEAGGLKLHSTAFDLYRLLDNLYEMLHLKASAKQLRLTFHRPPHLPQYINTDEGKLRQVLLNLLGNAIKFTQQGHVILRVSSSKTPVGIEQEKVDELPFALHPLLSSSPPLPIPLTLRFEVEDTGPGIAPNDLQWLFTPFVQTHAGRQSSEGTGLGLTISQTFVQLMGGRITVESVAGKGSLFYFDLQATPAPAMPLSVPNSTQQIIGLAPNHRPYRVLVIEDRWENQQVLEKLLQPLGFEVQVADNGQEGIKRWEAWQPQIILMDMRMPVMDGYEATQQIRARESWSRRSPENDSNQYEPSTKIIAVTSSAFDKDRSAILAIGCNDFVSKPFREEEILAKLAQHLEVQYIYANNDAIERNQESDLPLAAFHSVEHTLPLEAVAFNGLSAEWIAQLHKAAILGKDGQMLKLLEQLPTTHMNLAQRLQTLINNFRFEKIIELTQPAKKESKSDLDERKT